MLILQLFCALASCHLVRGDEYLGEDYIQPIPPVTGGWIPSEEMHPWAVGVHRRNDDGNFEHICGGSLIFKHVVLSAAHCFWNNGAAVPLEQYRISVGNFKRALGADLYNQQREVKEIIFHERYRGSDINYTSDIAIVLLDEAVLLSAYVLPIAVDWNNELEDTSLTGQYGTVVGWGFNEFDKPSETRITVSLPFVNFDDCFGVVPRDFRSYLTPDKFCAGLQNGTAVCPGDSGGGLAFCNPRSDEWYLRGIVSVGVRPKDKSMCHKTQYSLFTSISHYSSWLRQKLNISTVALESEQQLLNISDQHPTT